MRLKVKPPATRLLVTVGFSSVRVPFETTRPGTVVPFESVLPKVPLKLKSVAVTEIDPDGI